MKKIINKNRSRLVFPRCDLAIEPNEIKEVTEDQYKETIDNAWIEDTENQISEEPEIEINQEEALRNEDKQKGRKKKIIKEII